MIEFLDSPFVDLFSLAVNGAFVYLHIYNLTNKHATTFERTVTIGCLCINGGFAVMSGTEFIRSLF